MTRKSINELGYECLLIKSTAEKVTQTNIVRQQWLDGQLNVDHQREINPSCEAGWPDKPQLVEFNKLPKRSVGSEKATHH